MSQARDIVASKTAEIVAWEKRKQREQLLAAACFYSLLVATLASPLYGSFFSDMMRWFMPVAVVLVLAPPMLFLRRWRHGDSVRALVRADRALRLEERALTAWELLQRDAQETAGLLVFKQAGEKLAGLEAKKLFGRTWTWQVFLLIPLSAIWFGLLWFNPRFDFDRTGRPSRPALAYELREFSRELQAKAKTEDLRESLRLSRELERVAQKGIDSSAGKEQMRSALAAVMKRIDAAEKSVADPHSFAAGESQQSLTDLKTELQAARDLANFSPGDKPHDVRAPWLERLAAMPQLKRRFEESRGLDPRLNPSELKSFLDRLERQVTRELDRRGLLDAQQFLQRMVNRGNEQRAENEAEVDGHGNPESSVDAARTENSGSLPGTEPGKKPQGLAQLPEFPGGAPTHLEGLLGAGESSGMPVKGQPTVGKSKMAQEEIIASYRRQAEADLSSEHVPEALKETVKQYFLSLGSAPQQ